MTSYEFGDIVLVDFPQTGTSERKRRPALVILDIGDDDIILAPVTTVERTGRGDGRLQDWQKAGLLRESWIRLAKVACLPKADTVRRLGQISTTDRNLIGKKWQTLYGKVLKA